MSLNISWKAAAPQRWMSQKSKVGRKLKWELFSSLMPLYVDKRVRRRGSFWQKQKFQAVLEVSASLNMIFPHGGWSGGPEPNTWCSDAAGPAGQAPVKLQPQKLLLDLTEYNFPFHMCKTFYPLASSWLLGGFFSHSK